MGKDKSKTASWLKTHIYDVAAYAGLAITDNSLSDLQWR